MRAHAERFELSLLIGLLLAIANPAAAVTIEWVTVGDPGNAADTAVMRDGTTGYGSVAYAYRISKYEVTNSQYAEFLNAMAVEDGYDLYNPEMNDSPYGGIAQNGSPGSFSYSVKDGFASKPVNFVSIVDAAYFANWLNNGQPVQSPHDPPLRAIRTGAYNIHPDPTAFTRSADATIFLPTEDEWYKAAYYDPSSPDYFLFPTSSNHAPDCTGPTGAFHSANCYHGAASAGPTPVGSYPGSPGPYGTFDQGGNATEWTETRLGPSHVVRGGPFYEGFGSMVSSARDPAGSSGDVEVHSIGFRLAAPIPEPQTGLLLTLGLLGLASRRRFLG